MIRKSISVLLATVFLLSMAACSKEDPQETEQISVETSATDTSASEETNPAATEEAASTDQTEATQAAPEGLVDPNSEYAVNPLTGVQDMDKANEGKRSVGIVVSNVQAAIPQRGVSTPDVIYEYITEGGVTRLLCVYSDIKDMPEIGSLRSGRIVSADLANGNNSIYIHFGREPRAVKYFAQNKITHIDGNYLCTGKMSSSDYNGYIQLPKGTYFWRDRTWASKRAIEHTAVTDGVHVKEAIEAKKIKFEGKAPFLYNFVPDNSKDIAGGEDCTYVKAVLSSYMKNCVFEYNAEDGLYYHYQYGKAQKDETNGQQVAVKNVFILFARTGPANTDGRTNVYLDEGGEGYYLSNGKKIHVKWTKKASNEQIKIYNDAGEEVEVNRGKSYIAIGSKGNYSKIKFTKED